jgi:hypothetical protein
MKHSGSFSATTACLVALLTAPRLSSAGSEPLLQWDPETTLPCVMWEDNTGDLVCEEVRDYWTLTPEEFSRWNPSVGLDCKPWRIQSYCVVPQERIDNDPRPNPLTETTMTTATATSEAATSTTSTSSLAPSPTAWNLRGCYPDEDKDLPVLEEQVSVGDDLTISKCQDSCYRASFEFAGVKEGNECWCSSFIGGESTRNESDCNIPCTGDEDEICGGKDRLSVFEPVEADEDEEDTNDGANDQDEDQEEDNDQDENESNQPEDNEDDDHVQASTTSGAVSAAETADSGASRFGILFF